MIHRRFFAFYYYYYYGKKKKKNSNKRKERFGIGKELVISNRIVMVIIG
jgi:hypothetical protein